MKKLTKIKKILKEIVSENKAYYDVTTEKIHNCEEGTTVWHHEDRHRQQFTLRFLQNFQKWYPYSYISFAFLGFLVWLKADPRYIYVYALAGLLVVPHSLLICYLEFDAWIYAIPKRWSELENGD